MVNSSRTHLTAFVEQAADSIPKGSLILDAGCGDSAYRPLFESRGVMYEGADFGEVNKHYAALTYRCRLDAIPVEDNRFDMVLLSQVLEHLPNPIDILRELHRILKPSSRLWLSAPLFYEEHEQPYDFYRYTQFGMRYQVESAGFKIERLEWMEGYGMTVAHQLRCAAQWLPRSPAAYGSRTTAALVRFASPLFTRLANRLAKADEKQKITNIGMPKNYVCVAVKPIAP